MNRRTLFIIVLVIAALIIAYQSFKKFSIKKTSDEGRTSLELEVKKEKHENNND